MKHKPLIAYLLLVTVISGGLIVAMKAMGERGFYLAAVYMLGPAVAALITRIFFHDGKFRDAHLRFGRIKHFLQFWIICLVIVAVSNLMYTLVGSVTWDFSGDTFLKQLEKQMAASGQDMTDLPEGFTPKTMLLLFVVGGLTVFNIPLIITGFGEEFGWRGLMFPLLYRIRPWMGFVIGGLIWFAWHVPLIFVLPQTHSLTNVEHALNTIVLAAGSVFAFTFFAYVYIKSQSIWVVSFAHTVFNNAARSFGYFVTVENQVMANLALTVTMGAVVAWLYWRKELQVFQKYFEQTSKDASP